MLLVVWETVATAMEIPLNAKTPANAIKARAYAHGAAIDKAIAECTICCGEDQSADVMLRLHCIALRAPVNWCRGLSSPHL